MQSVLQPFKSSATAGIAIVGAGLIAVTPMAAPPPDIHTTRDVALTAGDSSPLGDLLAPWVDQYNEAAQNFTVLANNFFLAPGVGLQQAIANQEDFWQQLADDPSSGTLADVTGQMQDNVNNVFNGFTLLSNGALPGLGGGGDPITDAVTDRTLSGEADLDITGNTISVLGHKLLLAFLPSMLPADLDPDAIQPILNFLASPLSGIIMGALGPFLSPVVALLNSIQDGDGFSEILANTVGAFFNGADLNLDFLAPLIADSGLLPEGTNIYGIDLALGGLFTPGVVASADNLVPGTTDAIAAPGGSIFNSLGLDLDASVLGAIELPAVVPSHAIGPIGAWEAWSQTIGVLLGSGWSGKNDPEPAIPPLTGASLPQIPDDFFDGSTLPGGAAGVDPTDWADVLAQLGGGDVNVSDIF